MLLITRRAFFGTIYHLRSRSCARHCGCLPHHRPPQPPPHPRRRPQHPARLPLPHHTHTRVARYAWLRIPPLPAEYRCCRAPRTRLHTAARPAVNLFCAITGQPDVLTVLGLMPLHSSLLLLYMGFGTWQVGHKHNGSADHAALLISSSCHSIDFLSPPSPRLLRACVRAAFDRTSTPLFCRRHHLAERQYALWILVTLTYQRARTGRAHYRAPADIAITRIGTSALQFLPHLTFCTLSFALDISLVCRRSRVTDALRAFVYRFVAAVHAVLPVRDHSYC